MIDPLVNHGPVIDCSSRGGTKVNRIGPRRRIHVNQGAQITIGRAAISRAVILGHGVPVVRPSNVGAIGGIPHLNH